MKNEVRAFIQPYAKEIWDIVRHKLQENGMHRAVRVLDPLGPRLITELVLFVLNKIAAAVSKLVDVKALKRNIKYYFRKWIRQSNPAPVFVV